MEDLVLPEVESEFYEIKESADFGRYLIAKKDIPERTLILDEIALVHVPADYRDENDEENEISLMFCLGCCIQLNQCDKIIEEDDKVTTITTTTTTTCSECGWPLCCDSCKSISLHKENECKVFKQNRVAFPPPHTWPVLYKSVLVLRIVILIKEKDPSIWERFFMKLEHHNDVREKKKHCLKSDKMILENLRYFLKLSNTDNYFDEEMLRCIIGYINVNGFCANKTNNNGPGKSRKSKCVFQKASLFAHSCAPNCSWTIDITAGNGYTPKIKVFASIPIKKTDLITIPYNTRHLFYGTLKRQLLIESVAHFLCKCLRCQDPTELGTFMSSIRCFSCEEGFLISENPGNHESRWICTKREGYQCKAQNVNKVVYFVTEVEEHFDLIQSEELPYNLEVEKLEKLFKKHYGVLLHKNHYTLQEISSRILELLVEKLSDVSLELVNVFLWHCVYLLLIADAVLPGYNGYRDQLVDYKAEGLFHRNEKKNLISKV